MRIGTTLSLCLAILTIQGFASAALTECERDSDCGENGICEKESWADGCDPTPEGNTDHCSTETMTAETGYCATLPPTCDRDEDCGPYLSCVPSDSGSCWASSDGQSGCTDPDPDAPKYCEQRTITCVESSDCPPDFECVDAPTYCVDIGCPDNEPDCGCSVSEQKECVPRAIECDGDTECPDDWSCLDGASACDGGLLISVDEEQACESSQSHCYPNAWNSEFATGGAVDLDSGEGAPSSASDDSATGNKSEGSSSGGCSVSPSIPGHGWLFSLLAFPLLFARRRRAGLS